MTVKHTHLAFIVTDAISFNLLMPGQLEYFRDHGIRLTLICGGAPDEILKLVRRHVGEIRHLPLRRQPSPIMDMVALFALTRLMFRTRFDAVIISTPKAVLLGTVAAFLARQRRRIVLVRGRAYERATGWTRRFYLTLDKLALACATEVLFISHSLRRAFEDDGISFDDKAKVLGAGSSNGVDTQRFRPPRHAMEKQRIRTKLGLPNNCFVVLVVGRINPDKGVTESAWIIKDVGPRRDICWIFVGPVESSQSATLLRSLEDHNVYIFPRSDQIERYFRAADLHLFLSHREGFGNVAIEAAASGIPTFAFDVVGVRDSVIDGVTGRLFDPADLKELSASIVAAANEARFTEKYPDIRSTIVARFANSRVWNRYLAAYVGRDGVSRQRLDEGSAMRRPSSRASDVPTSASGGDQHMSEGGER